MRYQFTLIAESDGFQPETTLHGAIADAMARALLEGVTITRLRIENLDEPQGAIIPADQCDCMTGLTGDGK